MESTESSAFGDTLPTATANSLGSTSITVTPSSTSSSTTPTTMPSYDSHSDRIDVSPHQPYQNSNSQHSKSTFQQLSDKIKQLEIEGNKLRASTVADLGLVDGTVSSLDVPKFSNSNSMSPSVAALVDISSEQRTIGELRLQLENQRKETDRLQSQFLSEGSSPSRSMFPFQSSPSKLAFSTLPSTDVLSSPSRRPFETLPPSHLEKSLKESQEQVNDLRKRIQEMNDTHDQQKRQFRMTIEELKSKLHETVVNRDTVVDLRQKEAANQESVIFKLETNLRQTQEKFKIQGEELREALRKLESHQQESYVKETALNHVRTVLSDMERKRGRCYFESEPVDRQGTAMLVHTFERCLQDAEKEAELKKTRLQEAKTQSDEVGQSLPSDNNEAGQLESDLDAFRRGSSEKEESLAKNYQEKCSQISTEHERQVQTLTDRASNARKQAANLQAQLQLLETQHEQQMSLKSQVVLDLEEKVKTLKQELSEDKKQWFDKRDNLEKTLETVQRELGQTKSERDEALKLIAALETKVANIQDIQSKLETDLTSEKDMCKKHWEREEVMKLKCSDVERKIEERNKEIERLEKMLEIVKQECNSQLKERVATTERYERDRHLEQISNSTTQLSSVTDRCNRVSMDLELSQKEVNAFKQQLREYTEKYESAKLEINVCEGEKKHISNLLTDKTKENEKLSQERDRYFDVLEQRNNELVEVKTQKERLFFQLEEKNKNFELLKQQSESMSNIVEANTKTNEVVRDEKDKLMRTLTEKTTELEEIRINYDKINKALKVKDKKVKEVEGEKVSMTEVVHVKEQEVEVLKQEKENLFKELKQSRYDAASLVQEKDKWKKSQQKKITDLEKEVSRLQSKLKAREHEYKLVQRTIQKQDSVDNKAVKVADKMQKEVTAKRGVIDSLQSKMHWLEDKVDSLTKDRRFLENDKEKLKTSLNRTLLQNQQLTMELEASDGKIQDLKNQMNKLETSLEKVTIKNATSEAQVEQFQQELARVKLIHQLDLKEVERSSASSNTTPRSRNTETNPSHCNHNFLVSEKGVNTSHLQSAQEDNLIYPGRTQESPRLRTHSEQQVSSHSDDKIMDGRTGSELKYLLTEMRSLVSDYKQRQPKEEIPQPKHSSSQERHRKYGGRKIEKFPKRPPKQPEYYSDDETESSFYRTQTDISGVSSLRDLDTPSTYNHKRRHSMDLSEMGTSKCLSESRLTENASKYSVSFADSVDLDSKRVFTNELDDSTSDSDDSDENCYSGFEKEVDSNLLPETEVLCKRLEKKLELLTKMGGNLQKENKEMADLIKVQGKKLKDVQETEKHLRKYTR